MNIKFKKMPNGVKYVHYNGHTYYVIKRPCGKYANGTGYDVYHTGPRPDIAAKRKAQRKKTIDTFEKLVRSNDVPFRTFRDARANIKYALMTFDSYDNVAA